MCNAVIFLVGDGEGDRSVMFSHCFDKGLKPFCDHIDMVICLWVGCFVADDGFAEGNGVVDLRLGRVYHFKDQDSDSFNLGRGGGEVREVFLDLTGGRGGFLLANIPFEC